MPWPQNTYKHTNIVNESILKPSSDQDVVLPITRLTKMERGIGKRIKQRYRDIRILEKKIN